MSDELPTPAKQPPSSAPRATSPLRMVLLLGVFGIALAGLLYDYIVARPAHKKANSTLEALVDGEMKDPSGDGTVSDAEVQDLIGRPPTETKALSNGKIELYTWRSGLPTRTYKLWVVYTGRQLPLLHSFATDREPSGTALPQETQLVPKPTEEELKNFVPKMPVGSGGPPAGGGAKGGPPGKGGRGGKGGMKTLDAETPDAPGKSENAEGKTVAPDEKTQPPVQQDPIKVEPAPDEPGKMEPAQEQPPKQEPAQTEPAQPATTQPETEKPAGQEPVKEEPAKEEPAIQPPVMEPPVTQEPAKEPPVTEPPVKEEPAKEPPVTEPPVKEEPAKEPPVTEPAKQ